jgi:hypothetical protein
MPELFVVALSTSDSGNTWAKPTVVIAVDDEPMIRTAAVYFQEMVVGAMPVNFISLKR